MNEIKQPKSWKELNDENAQLRAELETAQKHVEKARLIINDYYYSINPDNRGANANAFLEETK